MIKKVIVEKEISARFSNVRPSEVQKLFPNLRKFTTLPEQKCLLKTARGSDVSGCAFVFNEDGNAQVLRFGEKEPYSMYQIEPLEIWDPDATLIVLPVEILS